jgi:hypothetical protein
VSTRAHGSRAVCCLLEGPVLPFACLCLKSLPMEAARQSDPAYAAELLEMNGAGCLCHASAVRHQGVMNTQHAPAAPAPDFLESAAPAVLLDPPHCLLIPDAMHPSSVHASHTQPGVTLRSPENCALAPTFDAACLCPPAACAGPWHGCLATLHLPVGWSWISPA